MLLATKYQVWFLLYGLVEVGSGLMRKSHNTKCDSLYCAEYAAPSPPPPLYDYWVEC